jgi:ADP-ribosyl-[dinitrogen reductase] hydrolase
MSLIGLKQTSPTSTLTLEQRAVGAYLGLAIGDALGATVEFLTPREIQEKHGVHDKIIGGGWLRLKAGNVTDDTEMSLALGDSILAHKSVVAEAVAEAFSDWMRSKPIDIGNTVRRGIIHFRNSGEAYVAVNEYDAGNGACMRCLPAALFACHASEEERIRLSRIQSHTTHNNPLSDSGTEAVMDMVIAALNGESKERLEETAGRLVEQHSLFNYKKKRSENPSGYIVDTLKAVFQGFFSQDTFEDILVDVVNRGGDADTTGAIAGMLAGALYGPDNIPARWRSGLNIKTMLACRDQALNLVSLSRQIYQNPNP